MRNRCKPPLILATVLAALALPALAEAADGKGGRSSRASSALSGRVLGGTEPVRAATVFAYEVASYALEKVETDRQGRFLFRTLPAGMYQLVVYKDGFAPAVQPLLRRRDDAAQFLEIRLRDEADGEARDAEDYWAVRSRVPVDVLREIQQLALRDGALASGAYLDGASAFAGEVQAGGGVDNFGPDHAAAQLTAAELALRGDLGDLTVGINGRYQELAPRGVESAAPEGLVRAVAVELESQHLASKLSLATSTSELANLTGDDGRPVGLEHYQLDWSSRVSRNARSGVSAQYTQESRYHQPGWVDPVDIPEASRLLDVQGFYRGQVSGRTSLEAGVGYRQLDGRIAPPGSLATFDGQTKAGDPLLGGLDVGQETISAYGLAGSQVVPRVLVEYGLYSSVRDGSWSLMPHGGMVLQLGPDWKARTSFSQRVEDEVEVEAYQGFRSAFFSDRTSCLHAGEACYEVVLTRGRDDDDQISIGALHREYAETLRVYFSPDFFNRLESLFLVEGDSVPELQFRMVRRISPRVLAKLESNYASGGGGIFYATDEVPYENEVRYLVTSLDTRFQSTATGVFLAFHQLEQALNRVDQPEEGGSDMELQRLQLMLTQDLSLLADVASNLAVRFNVELSRGSTPYTLAPDDELRKKLTGGIAVSF